MAKVNSVNTVLLLSFIFFQTLEKMKMKIRLMLLIVAVLHDFGETLNVAYTTIQYFIYNMKRDFY